MPTPHTITPLGECQEHGWTCPVADFWMFLDEKKENAR